MYEDVTNQDENNIDLSSVEDAASFPVPYMYVHITVVAKLTLNSFAEVH